MISGWELFVFSQQLLNYFQKVFMNNTDGLNNSEQHIDIHRFNQVQFWTTSIL